MFDPIQGPAHPGQGPSTGDSTENGDSWHAAVAKINAGFQSVKSAFERGYEHFVEIVDPVARQEVFDLRAELTELKLKIEALTTPPAVPPTETQAGLGGATGTGDVG